MTKSAKETPRHRHRYKAMITKIKSKMFEGRHYLKYVIRCRCRKKKPERLGVK